MEYNGPADTAALAATCRTFHDPALYLLWRYPPPLVPLVKCLPYNTYKIQPYYFYHQPRGTIVRLNPLLVTTELTKMFTPISSEEIGVQVAARMLRDEDFRQWRARVPWVKNIGTRPDGRRWTAPRRYKLDISFYDSFEFCGVLPIDHLISYTRIHLAKSVTFYQVIGPRVVELAFSGYPGPHPPRFYPQGPLKITLPHTLRVLQFGGIPCFYLSLFHDVLLTLPRLEVLHYMNIFYVSDALLRDILSSATLQELKLGNSPQHFGQCLPSQTPLRLRHLGMRTDNSEECIAVFTLLNTSHLESIKIQLDYDRRPFPTGDYPHFFESLASCCSTSLLKRIALIDTDG